MSKLSDAMTQAINDQINNELYASYSYLAMSAYCEQQQFTGCAQWMRVQSQEENEHAMRLFDFLIDRGERVRLAPIAAPQIDFESVASVFTIAYAQEQTVTAQIESLYELAFEEKAFAAMAELDWFIKEQVEEEKTARDIVHKFGLVGGDPAALVDLDRELGTRPPEAEAAAGE